MVLWWINVIWVASLPWMWNGVEFLRILVRGKQPRRIGVLVRWRSVWSRLVIMADR